MTEKRTRLDTIVNLIETRRGLKDTVDRAWILETIVMEMAKTLKAYCNQQGNGCERCIFRLPDPERQNCECRINIGKNELGTAPRFWELTPRKRDENETTKEPMQSGMSGQKDGMSQ